jgi:hypothetical protein
MALDSVTLAISPYIARANKAVKFYAENYNLISNKGLMLAIAEGPILAGTTSSGWPVDSTKSEVVPLPSLNTYDLDNVIGFKRVKNLSFVIPDSTGYISVGGNTWSKLSADTYEDLIKLVYVKRSRWLYVEAELLPTEFVNKTYRQIGLYSSLEVEDSVDYVNKNIFLPTEIKQVEKTTTLYDNRIYSGFLEVYQNKVATIRSTEYKELFAWVLEF